MTHEEIIKKSDERIAQSKKVSAQLDELIRTTNEKLKRMDDENMRLLSEEIVTR